MTEPRTNRPTGWPRGLVVEGNEMDAINETAGNVEAIEVREAAQSFHDYIASRVDIDVLSPAEVVELTFAFHAEWQSSPERKAERENAKVLREVAAAEKREAREAERATRLLAEKAALEAKLAKLSSKA